MERAVDALRADGESFTMQLMTLAGHAIEADGRAIGGRAVLRLRDVSGIKRELAELNARHEKFAGEMESLRALIDALPSPVWARDLAGALVFVNPAYRARGRGQGRRPTRIARGVELLDRTAARRGEPQPRRRQGLSRRACRRSSPAAAAPSTCSTCRPARAAPASASTPPKPRRCAASSSACSTPTAAPSTSSPTGVATFGADQKLAFYNAAYRSLWDLDAGFLDQAPTDSARARPVARRAQAAGGAGLPRSGRPRCTRPIAPPKPRSTSGTCPTAARCASSPRPTRRAASPICSRTPPSGSS